MTANQSYVYFASCDPHYVKIGWSIDPVGRMTFLRSGAKWPNDADINTVQLIGAINGGRQLEQVLHDRFRFHRVPGTEWFRGCPEIESYLESLTFCSVVRRQKEESKLNMVYPAALLRRIDDFRFTHRFESRTDTIRWLLETCLDSVPDPKRLP